MKGQMPKEDNMTNIIEPSQACFGYFGSNHKNGVMAFRASKAKTGNLEYSLKYESIFKEGIDQ